MGKGLRVRLSLGYGRPRVLEIGCRSFVGSRARICNKVLGFRKAS